MPLFHYRKPELWTRLSTVTYVKSRHVAVASWLFELKKRKRLDWILSAITYRYSKSANLGKKSRYVAVCLLGTTWEHQHDNHVTRFIAQLDRWTGTLITLAPSRIFLPFRFSFFFPPFLFFFFFHAQSLIFHSKYIYWMVCFFFADSFVRSEVFQTAIVYQEIWIRLVHVKYCSFREI